MGAYDQSLVANLSSDLSSNSSMEGKKLAAHIESLENKMSDIPPSPVGPRISPIAMDVCSLREAPCLDCLLGLTQPRPQIHVSYV